MDDSFVSLFNEVLVGFLDKFTVIKKLADDLDVRLHPTRPGSAMPTTLNGLYGDNLFDALVALQLPAEACQGLRPGNEERLQVVLLEATRARGRLDDSFVSLFDEVLVDFLDKFTVVKKLADDFDVSLQPTRPSSAMPATLSSHYGNNLFDALVALRLPAVAPENVHLEVALAAQRLAQQDTMYIITHVCAHARGGR